MRNHPFVRAVFENLKPVRDGLPHHFLLACSGGADSTALLLVFHALQPQLSCRLTVITVDHNIRAAGQSAADAAFVAALCRRLAPPIPCITEELPAGAVARCAEERRRGIEDAARALRYRIFTRTAASVGADFIVTAHNKSDGYETALMRLFQGGGTASLRTMPALRGQYLRPLITVERSAIESFLTEQGAAWCEDATNAEDRYLRNRIRHILTPALGNTFGSWHTGLDKTLQRISLDCSFCDASLEAARAAFRGAADWQRCKHGALSMAAAFFDALHPALRLRLLEQGCTRLAVETRIPFGILRRMATESPQIKITAAGDLRLEHRGERLFLFRNTGYRALYKQRFYVLTIKECGRYPYPLGMLKAYEARGGVFLKDEDDEQGGVGPFTLPITVRAGCGGDRIQMKGGGLKAIKKIFNEWHVDSLARALLPIIIADNRIRALYGGLLGYKNRYVEEK